jgi:translation initiation factor 2B subunit (eIF-2B alpha/beta/delta family)
LLIFSNSSRREAEPVRTYVDDVRDARDPRKKIQEQAQKAKERAEDSRKRVKEQAAEREKQKQRLNGEQMGEKGVSGFVTSGNSIYQ